MYELFQEKSGRKISKSVGNVLTPQDWLNYASPASLRLLMFKRIVGARNLSVEDIPTYMDEFDELEEYYFSKSRDSNAMKDARLRGLYEYTVLTRVPDHPGIHIPYKQVAGLAVMAPAGNVEEFVTKRLIVNGAVESPSPELSVRIAWAANWAREVHHTTVAPADPESKAEAASALDPKTMKALVDFSAALPGCMSADDVQGAAFQAIRSSGVKPPDFFSAVYRIMLGSDRGPRLGPYIMDAGVDVIARKIRDAVES
jgi:lysyl-tRNA synthetase class 1